MKAQERSDDRFAASGFFVLRTPLLPFDDIAAWSVGVEALESLTAPDDPSEALERDYGRLKDRLLAAIHRPELREAIYLASTSLDASLEAWQKDPATERGRRLESALVAYFTRAAARATPFGLFAGCTTGTIGRETRLRLPPRNQYQRYSRIDMDYVWALAEAVEHDPVLRHAFTYATNNSLYEVAGRLRLAEGRVAESGRSYHLVAIDKTPELTTVLEHARDGTTLHALAQALINDEITQVDAEEYVAELADSQVLVADIRPPVTGDDPMDYLITTFSGHLETAEVGKRLDEVRAELKSIDAEGPGVSPSRYGWVAEQLSSLPAKPNPSRLVQVDLVKPALHATLSGSVVTEMETGARMLHQLAPNYGGDALSRFREGFSARYETREVPLVEALDEEIGIGFQRSESPLADASPLLAQLPFPGIDGDAQRWTARDALLLNKLAHAVADGAREINLQPSDVRNLATENPPPLPDAFHVMATVAASSEAAIARGDFRILLHSVGGPSGARMLGRFCHADHWLLELVRTHLRAEESHQPERLFAEIVHLPEGRIGNILCRPVLRDYEIPYLGRSGVSSDYQIPVTDLLVSVREREVVLRSRRLGREIIPRLTTAHNYGWRSLGLYRFLCALQQQNVMGGLGWDWGALETAPFLPRVVSGKLVLSRACWNLDETDVRAVIDAGGSGSLRDLQAWRTRLRLPRHIALADDDNELVVDLDNILSVAAFAHQLRGRRRATLFEMFPPPDQLCVTGPEGHFVHELIVPFVKTAAPEPPRQQAEPVTQSAVARRFPPGSEWLYAKLYTGAGTADRVLNQLIGPLVQSAFGAGAADSWFFVRYGDPDWHLRLRLHGDPDRLHAEVLPQLYAIARMLLDDGLLWRVQLDTYEREVERYGGIRGIELAEQVFAADSEAALRMVGALSGDAGLDLRWRLAMLGIDLLFEDLGLSLEEKRSVARRSREGFGREFRVDGTFRNEVGKRYRAERANLEALLNMDETLPPPLAGGVAALRARSVRLARVTAELRQCAAAGHLSQPITDLAASYAHMHVNRLMRSAQRVHELVLYELLDRAYSSRAGRADPR
jgi:thiopeptide-type bacteriocin biosynthesis protein